MYSISICTARTQNLEYVTGFKSLTIVTDRRQYIEQPLGFKGVTIELDDIRSFALKIVHSRQYKRGITSTYAMEQTPYISPSQGSICFAFVTDRPLLQDVNLAFNWYATKQDGSIIPLDAQNTILYASSAYEFAGCLSGYAAEDVQNIVSITMDITNVSPPLLVFQNPIIVVPQIKNI